MTKKKKPAKKPTHTTIENCTFTNQPTAGETVATLARALEANAKALGALATQLTVPGAPMLVINGI